MDSNILKGPVYPIEEGTAGQQLYRALKRHQDKPEAFIDAQSGETLSYKKLLEITSRLAHALEIYGLNLNSVISIACESNWYYLYPVLAALYLGVTVAPINQTYTLGELRHAFNIFKPQLIFTSTKCLKHLLKFRETVREFPKIILLDSKKNIDGIECLDSFISKSKAIAFTPRVFNRNEQEALIMSSSGTTGLPKGVLLTHKNLVIKFAHCRNPDYGIPGHFARTVLNFMPLFHTFGLVTILGYLHQGLRTVLMERFEEDLFLRAIQNYKVDSVCLVPTILLFLAKSPLVEKYDLSSLQEVNCGAAPLPQEVEDAVLKGKSHKELQLDSPPAKYDTCKNTQNLSKFCIVTILKLKGIRQGYGLTETLVACLYIPQNDFRRGSSGKTLPFMTAKIVDLKTQKALGSNQQGELWLRGEMVMKGYAKNPKATKEILDEDGWIHSGDLAYYDEDEHIFIVDRLKELIKYKAFQVSPTELEALLLKHADVKDAVVFGIPNEQAGELPAAFVVLKPGKRLTEKELKDYVSGQVSSYKRLNGGIKFIKVIPKTATGKFPRKELQKLFLNTQAKL